MDKMFDYESLFTYMSLIFAIAIFIIVLYGCLSITYNENVNIEKFTENAIEDSLVMATIKDIEVDNTGGITKINIENHGKYYYKTPPRITFKAPSDGTIAEAQINLSETPVTGTDLYPITEIVIKPEKKGNKYRKTDKNLIVIETIDDYKVNADKQNPKMILTNAQKTTIIGLIDGCTSLSQTFKDKYKSIINKDMLRQHDVTDMISSLEPNAQTPTTQTPTTQTPTTQTPTTQTSTLQTPTDQTSTLQTPTDQTSTSQTPT